MAKTKRPANQPVDKQKQAEKRQRREARKLAEAKAKKAAQRKRRLKNGLAIAVAVLVLGVFGFIVIRRATPAELDGVTTFPNEGQIHIATGQTFAYATATPTSGTHSSRSPRCGISTAELSRELAVHALEHGTVVIWYQPTLAPEVVTELTDIVSRFNDSVVLSPNSRLTSPVVATSWRRLKAYSGADDELEEFINTYRNRGPESFRCAY